MQIIYEKPLAIKVFLCLKINIFFTNVVRNRVANLSNVGNPCTDGIKINEDLFMF